MLKGAAGSFSSTTTPVTDFTTKWQAYGTGQNTQGFIHWPAAWSTTGGSSSGTLVLTGASIYASTHKYGVESAVANTWIGWQTAQVWELVRGSVGGGFYAYLKFGFDTLLNGTVKAIAGLVPAGAHGLVGGAEPSTAINCVFFGFDSTDSNIQLMTNDGSGTCTKTDLGASFPAPRSTGGELYEATFSCNAGDSGIAVTLKKLSTGATYSATVTSNIPAATVVLGGCINSNGAGTASNNRVLVCRVYASSPQ